MTLKELHDTLETMTDDERCQWLEPILDMLSPRGVGSLLETLITIRLLTCHDEATRVMMNVAVKRIIELEIIHPENRVESVLPILTWDSTIVQKIGPQPSKN